MSPNILFQTTFPLLKRSLPILAFTLLGTCLFCQIAQDELIDRTNVSLMVVGIAQDAGYPQIQCKKSCCVDVFKDMDEREMVACVALIDHEAGVYFLLDATPDIKDQMQLVEGSTDATLAGILLTHAHIGHYTGLMYLGREAMGATKIPVYAMPRMTQFLRSNGPWSQLVSLNNVELRPMQDGQHIALTERLSVTPHLVPHRDEFSETVGFEIRGISRTGWFIPDIDKWERWQRDIRQEMDHDFLLLDGSFYRNGEIWGRDMSEIPHPFIVESMALFDEAKAEEKAKIHFIHFNHTNPAMWDPDTRKIITDKGFNLAHAGMVLQL